ncbi:Tetratricopeptide-like helical domain containing protein [Parasponia andersonii]|uniref:Tetratricopeptide repeat protein 38 n=1 Tax=Parasponia andersonii TaxID=3476 RepID=A0A2P5D2E5_PARAD|nr:Tetratricopeptide-like helical domain containing protein [Parasponia andersonii]
MEGAVKRDQWGYQVSTSSEACISAINDYYHQVLTYGRERSVILKATVHDKDCVLANILVAHFLSSSDPSRAPSHLHAAVSRLEQATSYEKAVFDAVKSLVCENRDDDVALESHFKLLKDFPKDLVSLKRAQVLCFYMGRPDLSLSLVQQVLPPNEQESYIYGMLAFPLLELGRMADAEKAARKALEINKQDCWAQHNFCHVLQYECRFKDAVEFMEACSSSWGSLSSFMITHNWWHVAICYLEGHSPIQRVLEVYDQRIWKELERADASVPEVYLNAVGLILRMHVRGELDVLKDRLKILVSSLTDKGNWFMEWHFDVLILWALANANELSKAEDLLKGLRSRVFNMSDKKKQLMQRGLSLAEAMYEYGRGNGKQALEFLGPNFDAADYKIIGASDEQVDVFNEVWYSMLLNTGQASKLIEVLGTKIKKREGVPFLWRLLERAYSIVGSKEAKIVGDRAKVLESAYFE